MCSMIFNVDQRASAFLCVTPMCLKLGLLVYAPLMCFELASESSLT